MAKEDTIILCSLSITEVNNTMHHCTWCITKTQKCSTGAVPNFCDRKNKKKFKLIIKRILF